MEPIVVIAWILLAVGVAMIGGQKKIGFGMALLWSLLLSPLIGLIIVLISDSGSNTSTDPYKRFLDAAGRAKFKGNYAKAIDHYQDALYHLKHDYKTYDQSRAALIQQIEGIIAKLKTKAPAPADPIPTEGLN